MYIYIYIGTHGHHKVNAHLLVPFSGSVSPNRSGGIRLRRTADQGTQSGALARGGRRNDDEDEFAATPFIKTLSVEERIVATHINVYSVHTTRSRNYTLENTTIITLLQNFTYSLSILYSF